MTEREQEDQLNDRKRPKIGVTAFEKVSVQSRRTHEDCPLNSNLGQTLDQEVTRMLKDESFDAEDRTTKVWPHVGRYDLIKSRLW